MGQPLAMQMSVCHRHPVIMLYLCLMPFRRKPSGGRLVSCSLTVRWLHRPGRLLEARVMKADIVSCLWGKGSWICTSALPRCGAEGHSVSPEQRFGFWSVAPPSRPRACPSFRWPQFMALSSEPSLSLCGIPPFPPIILSQMTQCGASGIAAHCIGHRSAVRWLLQRTAPSVPL